MGQLRCVDGSVLTVVPVPCRDQAGTPYEITLELRRDDQPFARVGERCGSQLSGLAAKVAAARSDPGQAAAWPDPDDRFPGGAAESLRDYRPAEREYFSLRARDRADLPGSGELRCTLRDSAQWQGSRTRAAEPGRRPRLVNGWELARRAVIEAWGETGIGVRAVLTSAELMTFLDTVLSELPARVRAEPSPAALQRGGNLLSGSKAPSWRQQGRMPDGTARTRLPALRAQARSLTLAGGDAPACRSDVRR